MNFCDFNLQESAGQTWAATIAEGAELLRNRNQRCFVRAASFAAARLGTHVRKKSEDRCIDHARRVAEIVVRRFDVQDPHILTLALLHDIIEDSETTIDEVAALFGNKVAGGVASLTKPILGPKPARRRLFFRVLCSAPESVKLVKLADLLDNVQMRRPGPRAAGSIQTAVEFLGLLRRRELSLRLKRATLVVEADLAESSLS